MMKHKLKSMKVLAVIASVICVKSAALLSQFPVDQGKLLMLHKKTNRQPNSYFMSKNDSYRNINTEPPPEESCNSDAVDSWKQGSSHHRVGGRRKHTQLKEDRLVFTRSVGAFFVKYRKLIIWTASALLVGAIVFGQMFNFNTPSYVYYQSSVIESRIVGSDGNVQTSRKETFKSNIPDLVREQQKRSREQSSTGIQSDSSTTITDLESPRALIQLEEQRLSEEMDQFEQGIARIRRELDTSIRADPKLLIYDFPNY